MNLPESTIECLFTYGLTLTDKELKTKNYRTII